MEVEKIQARIKEISERFTEYTKRIDLDKFNKQITYITTQLPVDVTSLLSHLSCRGWIVWLDDGSLSFMLDQVNTLSEKNDHDQDAYLCSYYEKMSGEIERELISAYPERTRLINDAFASHKAGYYGASIPAMLALAESICRANLPGIGLYEKSNGRPKTASALTTNLSTIELSLLEQLKVKTSVTEKIDEPLTSDQNIQFNRHAIMHGLSHGYATEINSYKAIALVNYAHKACLQIIS